MPSFKIGLLAGLAFLAAAETGTFVPRGWPSEAPSDCPFEPSKTVSGVRFTGRWARYAGADTWYPSWASDGNLYSPWTDGRVGTERSNSAGPQATTGYATIVGDDPLHLQILHTGTVPGDPAPYGGRYPSASLVRNGIWYYGTYCLMDSDGDPGKGLNWDTLGPFVGFRVSRDFGRTWTEGRTTPSQPLFPEPLRPGDKVRFGAPHFVDFGRNMQYSPDGRAYLVGHGARDPDPRPRQANASWVTGDQVYLARVKPTRRGINNRDRWQYFAGYNFRGKPLWTHEFLRIKPLIDWNNNCGNVSMTYDAPLRKYLMIVTDGGNTISRFNTYVLESDHVTGPWKLVVYMRHFGEQGYFVNIPSKFISADGRKAWLCYSANFSNGNKNWNTHHQPIPPGSGYGLCLQEIELLGR
jgi:hypothetical protein